MREALNYLSISLLAIFQSLSCNTEKMEVPLPYQGSTGTTVQETPEVRQFINRAHYLVKHLSTLVIKGTIIKIF